MLKNTEENMSWQSGILWLTAICLMAALVISPALADTMAPSNEELARRIEILTAEIERLKTGEIPRGETKTVDGRGMGPSASKVYGVDRGLSIGGYGEIVYTNYAAKNACAMNLLSFF
jgi:hypothetical protein